MQFSKILTQKMYYYLPKYDRPLFDICYRRVFSEYEVFSGPYN